MQKKVRISGTKIRNLLKRNKPVPETSTKRDKHYFGQEIYHLKKDFY